MRFFWLAIPICVAATAFADDAAEDFRALMQAVPEYPGIEAWKFREELKQPEALRPVPTNDVKFVRAPVAGYESYRIDVEKGGAVTITTEDDEGLRRAVYYYQDRVRAGDLVSCVRKPWLKNRISRCFFGPIKRPPLNHDELMDDIDYYPDAYLDRLAHEGVNGLWITVEWRDLATTSFAPPRAGAERRLRKLRATVDKCLRFGIKTWIFCIEPKSMAPDDPILQTHPDMTTGGHQWESKVVLCPSSPKTRRYIEESVRDIFSKVPRLGGIIMIAHGERNTTCLSMVSPVDGRRACRCHACDRLAPWQIYELTTQAIVRGIRAAGSSAEYVSWFYQPAVPYVRAPWVADVARHVPEGAILAYNFESGAVKSQLGRYRPGGDYWLSFTGPAAGFKSVAEAGQSAGCAIGAKIQVCNSHECATVPYVPVPGLLYRKYREMKRLGVSTVLQCWYFGNYPGVMNKAAGELAFETFEDGEDRFLERLAASYWGKDAKRMASLWEKYSNAYAEYPLSNDMQYYGPFHAGIAWPYHADVDLHKMGRTWKPLDAPSGDVIGEALENHTIEEATMLARRMAEGVDFVGADGHDALTALAERWRGDHERMRDLGVMEALRILFKSGYDAFDFYSSRAKAVYESRVRGNPSVALAMLHRMDAATVREEALTRRMLPLAEEDSRLGFHSEAEAHQFHPAKLRWRLETLAATRRRIAEIRREIAAGRPYPESRHEREAASCRVGATEWTETEVGLRFKAAIELNGDLTLTLEAPEQLAVNLQFLDAAGVTWYRCLEVNRGGVRAVDAHNTISPLHEIVASRISVDEGRYTATFTLSAMGWGNREDRRPSWMRIVDSRRNLVPIWPKNPRPEYRLNLTPCDCDQMGRLVY